LNPIIKILKVALAKHEWDGFGTYGGAVETDAPNRML
jgi:hypothetical protein